MDMSADYLDFEARWLDNATNMGERHVSTTKSGGRGGKQQFFLGCYIVYLAMSTLNLWLILPGHVLWGGSLHGGYGWPKDVETLKCWKLDSCHLAHWEKSIEEVEDCGSVFIFQVASFVSRAFCVPSVVLHGQECSLSFKCCQWSSGSLPIRDSARWLGSNPNGDASCCGNLSCRYDFSICFKTSHLVDVWCISEMEWRHHDIHHNSLFLAVYSCIHFFSCIQLYIVVYV